MKVILIAAILSLPPLFVTAAHSQLLEHSRSSEETALGWLDSVRQTRQYSCGPALLASIARANNIGFSELHLVNIADIHHGGITLAEFRRLAFEIGWSGNWFAGTYDNLLSIELPIAAHINSPNDHFVLVHYLHSSHVVIEDPDKGFNYMNRAAFENAWSGYFYVSD